MADELYAQLRKILTGQGMAYIGIVTAVPGANQFSILGLAGKGDTSFVGWHVYVFWDAGGAGAAPQSETQDVTVYTSAGGVFTTNAFTAPVGIGDNIILIHPSISTSLDLTVPAIDAVTNLLERDVIGNKADTADVVVGVTSSLARYIKGVLNQVNSIIAGTVVLTETGGTLTADGTEQNIVIDNAPAVVFKPLCVKVNLNNMIATDTIVIKVYERLSAGGALELSDEPVTYTGADGGLVGGQTQITINLSPNRYGFKVTLEQTAHVTYKDFIYEYFYEV